VELLVVATIFSIVGLGLGASFISGMKIWDRARHADFDKNKFILDMELVAADLRQGIYVPPAVFTGAPEELSLLTFSGDSVVKVSYIFDPEAKTLARRQFNREDISSPAEEGKYTERKLCPWENLAFSYLYLDSETEGHTWVDSWANDKGPLEAIRMTVEFGGERFVKTIFVPA
jgi:hypothetical protein